MSRVGWFVFVALPFSAELSTAISLASIVHALIQRSRIHSCVVLVLTSLISFVWAILWGSPLHTGRAIACDEFSEFSEVSEISEFFGFSEFF